MTLKQSGNTRWLRALAIAAMCCHCLGQHLQAQDVANDKVVVDPTEQSKTSPNEQTTADDKSRTTLKTTRDSKSKNERDGQQNDLPKDQKPQDDVTSLIDSIQDSAIQTGKRIAETIESMREVSQRVRQKQTGSETQRMQQDILTNLDSLIQAAKEQQQNQQQQNQKQRQRQQQQNQQQQKQRSPSQQQQQQPGQSPGKQPNGRRKDDGRESTTQTGEKAAVAARLAQRKMILKQVWGHLPERLRDRVLNMSDDRYLPKYETLIRRYFEALAKKRRSDQRSR